MSKIVFMLDEDKDFLKLYSALLKSKGFQVFATDNMFLLMKYAQTARPDWVFVDENFVFNHEDDFVHILDKAIPFKSPNYAVMSHYPSMRQTASPKLEFVYKPRVLEKVMQISDSCCNIQ